MVLTRRATIAAKFPSPRIPNELLDDILRYLVPRHLATVCRCSWSLHSIAIPILYRCVSFNSVSHLQGFLRTMKKKNAPHIVRQVALPGNAYDSTISPRLASDITECILRFLNLETLDIRLTRFFDFGPLLANGHFGRLNTFHTSLYAQNLDPLLDFVLRHKSTLVHLLVVSPALIKPLDLSARTIHLPLLQSLDVPTSLLPLFDLGLTCPLTCLRIDIRDAALDSQLMRPWPLGPQRIKSLAVSGASYGADNVGNVLAQIVTLLPCVQTLSPNSGSFRPLRISANDDVQAISAQLLKFSKLEALKLGAKVVENSRPINKREQAQIICGWHDVCKTLFFFFFFWSVGS
ncbi:hypothetical protein R3P38DRAFT_2724323 [Favolaschia claudopus]|uniref:F-box domain-containing protein n=1 Tax=Favolaschia claudopus TaxID=2862362 RepID=A0AAW0AHR1_9AGAR